MYIRAIIPLTCYHIYIALMYLTCLYLILLYLVHLFPILISIILYKAYPSPNAINRKVINQDP